MPSEPVVHQAPHVDPPTSRQSIRVTTIYATSWLVDPEQAVRHAAAAEQLRLGRLEPFYSVSADQMPHVLDVWDVPAEEVSANRWKYAIDKVRVWLFVTPAGRVVVAVTTDITTHMVGSVPLLEDAYYADLTVAGVDLSTWVAQRIAAEDFCDNPETGGFLPEKHQLVFAAVPDADHIPTHDQLQRVVYRADMAAEPESCSFLMPAELNRRITNVGAVAAYLSVVAGHQDYVENAVLLSAVLTIGSAASLRSIRQQVYHSVRAFREVRHHASLKERRLVLEEIAELLGRLELDLSFSVESTADLGMLIQAMRVESYHNALCESINLEGRAATTGRMLTRLRTAVADELISITSAEDRARAARGMRTGVAVTLITTVGGTLALLFSFFGVNATEVEPERSMFDPTYLPVYLSIAMIVASAGLTYVWLAILERRGNTAQQSLRRRSQLQKPD